MDGGGASLATNAKITAVLEILDPLLYVYSYLNCFFELILQAMAQGGVCGAASVVWGPRVKKPAPVLPDEHVPLPMVPAEHRTLLVQGLTPQISDELLETIP